MKKQQTSAKPSPQSPKQETSFSGAFANPQNIEAFRLANMRIHQEETSNFSSHHPFQQQQQQSLPQQRKHRQQDIAMTDMRKEGTSARPNLK